MLELICHHHYTWNGLPADKSPYRNPATRFNTAGSADGWEPGSGMIWFPQPDSRVRIPPGSAWQSLVALKIEVLARVDPTAKPLPMMVEGHGSFRFGLLEGALAAEFENGTGTNRFVRSAEAYAPDGKYHPVPTNRWVKLSMHHDGFARMRLFIDDELVGEAVIQGGIPPVQQLGVSVGNAATQDDRAFPGEIDELKIWRLDPRWMKREFLGRPYTREAAECWLQGYEAVRDWMASNPERRRSLGLQVGEWQRSFIRALFLLPDAEQARARAILAAFGELWFAGRIDGPEMAQVLCDWVALVRTLGFDPVSSAASTALTGAVADLKIDPRSILDCDPKIAAFIELLRDAAANCATTTEVAG